MTKSKESYHRLIYEQAVQVIKDTNNESLKVAFESLQNMANNTAVTFILSVKDPNVFAQYNGWEEFFDGEIGIDYNEWLVGTGGELPDYFEHVNSLKNTASPSTHNPTPRAPHGVTLNFVITGTLAVTRSTAEAKLNSLGHYVESRVISSTDYLIVGTAPGQTKLNAAKNHGVTQITERDALTMLGLSTW